MRPLLLALGGVLLVAACSSADSSSTTPSSTVPASTSTSTSSTSTLPPTTTTEAPKPKYPLTGLDITDEASALRPAVVAKIGNYDRHPQTGLNEADIVIEELINDGYTRFAAVYHSVTPTEFVGPIRSGRLQDIDLLGSFNQPVLAWSGGNGTVTSAIDKSDLVNMNQSRCNSACFRVDFDETPYNLYFNIEKTWTVLPEPGGTPPPQFAYRAADDELQGTPAAGADVTMDIYDSTWTWNASSALYERTQNGKPDTERGGELVTTHNVVIMLMDYVVGVSKSPDAQSVGSGEVFVLTGGNMVHGTWSRDDRLQPFTLTADDGTEILLSPGRTFIQLPRTSAAPVIRV